MANTLQDQLAELGFTLACDLQNNLNRLESDVLPQLTNPIELLEIASILADFDEQAHAQIKSQLATVRSRLADLYAMRDDAVAV